MKKLFSRDKSSLNNTDKQSVQTKSSLRNKLVFKIPVQLISLIIAVMLIICVILSVLLSKQMTASIQSEIDLIAQSNANTAVEYLNTMETRAQALASEVLRYKNMDEVSSGKMLTKSISSILEDDRIFAAYISFEPNAYKDGDKIQLDVEDDNFSTEDAYAQTKETQTTHLIAPYQYKLSTGETVWLVTISCPLIDESGKFIGVTNCDLKVDTLNALEYNLGGYKTSFSYMLTDTGKYVTNTTNKDLVGSEFKGNNETSKSILAAASSGKKILLEGTNSVYGGDAFIIHNPMNVSGVTEKWSSAFVVSKSEALKAVTNIVFVVAILALLSIILLSFLSFRMLRKSLRPIDSIIALANDMGNGVLNSDITVNTKDELGELASIFKNTSQTLSNYITEISYILSSISDGNLQVTVEHDYVGDFLPIKEALTKIIYSLNTIFKQIDMAADQVSVGSDEVSNGAQMLAQGSTEQASAIEELSASISTVADQVKQNANNAANANSQMSAVGNEMEKSNAEMNQMLIAMSDINESSAKIAKIIKAIEDIAFQTNILALNAAVEAARAGTAGKGFAVVADEVRNLAGKSAEAATNTTALIGNSIEAVESGMKIADATAKALAEAVNGAKEVIGLIEQISDASNEQAVSIDQITQGVEQIAAVVQTNSATAEESAAASEELSGQAAMLREEVNKFKLND